MSYVTCNSLRYFNLTSSQVVWSFWRKGGWHHLVTNTFRKLTHSLRTSLSKNFYFSEKPRLLCANVNSVSPDYPSKSGSCDKASRWIGGLSSHCISLFCRISTTRTRPQRSCTSITTTLETDQKRQYNLVRCPFDKFGGICGNKKLSKK